MFGYIQLNDRINMLFDYLYYIYHIILYLYYTREKEETLEEKKIKKEMEGSLEKKQ